MYITREWKSWSVYMMGNGPRLLGALVVTAVAVTSFAEGSEPGRAETAGDPYAYWVFFNASTPPSWEEVYPSEIEDELARAIEAGDEARAAELREELETAVDEARERQNAHIEAHIKPVRDSLIERLRLAGATVLRASESAAVITVQASPEVIEEIEGWDEITKVVPLTQGDEIWSGIDPGRTQPRDVSGLPVA